MTQGASFKVQPLDVEVVDRVVGIHRTGMGYTLNSKLGIDHMRYLYRTMAADPSCYVGMATEAGTILGVISGSTDADVFVSRLLSGMSAGRLVRLAARLAVNPWLLVDWMKSARIAAPVRIQGAEVKAVLTSIVVETNAGGKGVGRALVAAFEGFLREHGVESYRLDTRVSNRPAEAFYRRLGFREIARRADSIVFVRRVA